MTWNVENLLAVGADGGPRTQAELDAKLASLAQVIDAQQPDVLVLAALAQQLGHQLPHTEVSAHPNTRGIRVAFLGRLPLTSPVQLRPFPAALAPVQAADPPATGGGPPPTAGQLGRGAVQVTVTTNGQQLTIITAHLKSKLLTFPGDGSSPAMRGNAPGSAPTRCTCGRGRR